MKTENENTNQTHPNIFYISELEVDLAVSFRTIKQNYSSIFLSNPFRSGFGCPIHSTTKERK